MRAAQRAQLPMFSEEIVASTYNYGERSSGETHGVVLTKPHVVALILDLAGYTAEDDLSSLTLMEPACGTGAFLVPAVERLLLATRKSGTKVADLDGAIKAYDIDESHVAASRIAVAEVLGRHGVSKRQASELAAQWIVKADFLLATQGHTFDFVVGNPPYIRIEQLAPALQAEYRRRYESLYDRADLYVAFIERGLQLLSSEGVLSFICADRWIANKYGAPLRRVLTEKYRVECYVDLHTTSPFESEVIAYPSIFTIRRGQPERVHVVNLATASNEECTEVLPAIHKGLSTVRGVSVATYETWFAGDEPWVISSPSHLAALRALESKFQTVDADGLTKVGIGVATGADKVYIVSEDADIESNRLVPLVMREDIERGIIKNARRFVINCFGDDGKVVDLADYPRLAMYVERHAAIMRGRNVAKRSGKGWFRTIDRVYLDLVQKPKLLIPDIAGSTEVTLDKGSFHPHHNLYFVTSDVWDMEVLGGLLSSKVALFFVWSYAVKMRGGYLRFQAQYLRRIRLPKADQLPPKLAKQIKTAFQERDFKSLDKLALCAYRIKALPEFNFVDTRK